jgi:hypothetical protein
MLYIKMRGVPDLAKQERLGFLFMVFSCFGAFMPLIRACQLYRQGTVETITAFVYVAISVLCIFIVGRETVLFLKERRILD